jgi:8-oxo-dGTP pyrophosphatase MutT (NUDIX family)
MLGRAMVRRQRAIWLSNREVSVEQRQRPAVGVAVIITDGPRLLLRLRSAGHGAGSRQFPGGHLEYGESSERCALREAREERR